MTAAGWRESVRTWPRLGPFRGRVETMNSSNIVKYPQMTAIPAGFKRWSGHRVMPVSGLVEFVLRGWPGVVMQDEAAELTWAHDGGEGDIIAYRSVAVDEDQDVTELAP